MAYSRPPLTLGADSETTGNKAEAILGWFCLKGNRERRAEVPLMLLQTLEIDPIKAKSLLPMAADSYS